MSSRLVVAAVAFASLTGALGAAPIEFNRDVRPILSNNCFLCHGPDKTHRKAGLRLDTDTDVYADRGEGVRVLVPGRPMESDLYLRMTSHEPAKKMPPAKANKTVSPKELAVIKTWIEQGAKYQKHWSLIAPTRPELPAVKNEAWVRNPIDRFLLARLEKEGVAPAPEADRRTLLRRVSFDLTGLPPTPEEVDAFVADRSADAYEKVVRRLLASPHFGERMAMYWLDLVRFADTGGYHSDNHRDLTPYRDWVIDAFNKDMPYDCFTTAQIAGDLLPKAGWPEKIASGYNRLLQTTEEGGAQAKEYQAKYFADRVRNVSTVWLGLTLGCTQCHNHPYDPFTQKEFYRFGAFFADVQETPVGRQSETPITTPEQESKLKEFDAKIAAAQKAVAKAKADKSADVKSLETEVQKAVKTKEAYRNRLPQTLITTSVPLRPIRILSRGNWLDDKGEIVGPGTPASLPPLAVAGKTPTRLDLAKWLVSPENPLTARVFVNRMWMLTFGQGFTRPLDDIGSQGTLPTHPELLDWLAVEFQTKGWDTKALLQTIVTSNAYRQSSHIPANLKHRDPGNLLFAHQGRFRLDAELVRDNALAVSGLLADKVGGPSVKPYQPEGYWKFLNFPTRTWVADKGANQHRRGMYTYWQRTFLQPSLLAFDAPSREECTVERSRSNTPQQALVLLNDPTYVEASRAIAEKLLAVEGDDARIRLAFRLTLQRVPTDDERRVVAALVGKQRTEYRADAKGATAAIHVGQRPAPARVDAAELAAWTNASRTLLNLHESITRN
ncbi:MAG TPA: PSD1 and planctomycete cytochrome C domain-containing protein [Gemmataceae bacterium]|nr:PSD1 and planctomycete cytochrome C domain-containing protein [Gemmataceae bacterium]